MLLVFSRGFKDIVTKTAFFKEFPGPMTIKKSTNSDSAFRTHLSFCKK